MPIRTQLGDWQHPTEQREVQSLCLWVSLWSHQVTCVHCMWGYVQLFLRAVSAATFPGLDREKTSPSCNFLSFTSHLGNALMFVTCTINKSKKPALSAELTDLRLNGNAKELAECQKGAARGWSSEALCAALFYLACGRSCRHLSGGNGSTNSTPPTPRWIFFPFFSMAVFGMRIGAVWSYSPWQWLLTENSIYLFPPSNSFYERTTLILDRRMQLPPTPRGWARRELTTKKNNEAKLRHLSLKHKERHMAWRSCHYRTELFSLQMSGALGQFKSPCWSLGGEFGNETMNQFERSLGENGVGANVLKDGLHPWNLEKRPGCIKTL